MQARKRSILLAVLSLLLLVAGSAQANPYAKYAGTTLVVNFPNIAYYNYATNVIPEPGKPQGYEETGSVSSAIPATS